MMSWLRCRMFQCEAPRSIFFILGNEFCERFSYYGMRAVLILYLTEDLLYPRDQAKLVYHAATFLTYFMPLFGALLADLKLGKFTTIWTVSIVYTLGQVLLSVSSIHLLHLPRFIICLISLLIISVGAGGIKPCVAAFGGDQFDPSQYTARDRFYSLFYFFINTGALLSMILSPVFRADVYCFGKGNCYPLAFGFPAALMIIATVVFICGRSMYKINPAQGTVVVDVSKCIMHALRRRAQCTTKRDHWLDYADDKFDQNTIRDVKTAMSVLVMFLPIPVFWALFDQQGSSWTLQSAQMEGRTNFLGEIKPDQMDALNAGLVMVLVPAFTYGLYPLLGKFGLLTRPLQRMATGMLLAAIAFIVAAFVCLRIEGRLVAFPSQDMTELVLHNALPCNISVKFPNVTAKTNDISIEKYKSEILDGISIGSDDTLLEGSIEVSGPSCQFANGPVLKFPINVEGGMAYGILFDEDDNGNIRVQQAEEERSRDMQTHRPKVRFVYVTKKSKTDTVLRFSAESGVECADLGKSFSNSSYTSVRSNTKFDFCYSNRKGFVDSTNLDDRKCPSDCNEKLGDQLFDKGGIFTAILIDDGNTTVWNVINTGLPDSIGILNQVPQYFIITCGEVMLSVTALSFAYAESPDSLKSIFQAAWLLTVAFGNVIVLVVDAIKTASGVKRESISLFVYAALMILDMLLFAWLAKRYKYRSKFNSENTKM